MFSNLVLGLSHWLLNGEWVVGTEQSEEGSWEVVQGVVTALPSDPPWGWGQTACGVRHDCRYLFVCCWEGHPEECIPCGAG